MKSDLTLTSSEIIFGHTIKHSTRSPVPYAVSSQHRLISRNLLHWLSVRHNVQNAGLTPRLETLPSLEGRTWRPTCHSSRFIPLFLYSPITFRKRCFGEMVIGAGDARKLYLQHSCSREFTWACQLFLSSGEHRRRFGIRAASILSSTPTHKSKGARAQTPNIPTNTAGNPPFSKLAKPALRFFFGTFPVYVMHTFRFQTWINKLASCNEAQNCPSTNFGIRVLSVTICYKLDSPGLEPPCGRDLPYSFRPALWPN